MPTREIMRSLADDIICSFESRMNGIANIEDTVRIDLEEVQNFLKGLENSRATTGKELHADLAKDAAHRNADVAKELKGFHNDRKAMSKEMQNGFDKFRADLAGDRAQLKHSVGATLKGFGIDLGELRTSLAGGQEEWSKLAATMRAKRGGATEFMKESAPEFPKPQKARVRKEVKRAKAFKRSKVN